MIDVFISFKNTYNGEKTIDSEIAQNVYDKLKDMKLNVFMMNETLQKRGVSYYKKEIDKALEECRCLIVIGSNKDFFESKWVRYEWDTFLSEVIAGRKSENIFTIRLNNLQISELSIALRKYQSFDKNNFEQIYMWINNALTQKETIKKGFLYPAIFNKNNNEQGYTVIFPDLDISTDGQNLSEAYLYAECLLDVYFSYVLKYDIKFNSPTAYEEMIIKYPDCIIMYISAYIDFEHIEETLKSIIISD